MNNLPISPHALLMAGIAMLVCWRIYARYRRLIGRQRLGWRRLTVNVILFPMLLLLVGISMLRSTVMLEAIVAGVAVGIALGVYGLKLTRFEATDSGFYYTPNTVLGVGVMLLFVGRLAYRFGTLYLSEGRFDPATMQLGSSPLTLGIFSVVAAYYTTSAAGILLWYRKARGDVTASPGVAGTSIG